MFRPSVNTSPHSERTPAQTSRQRAYKIAKGGANNAWGANSSQDADIRAGLVRGRAKSRHLAENDPYMVKFYATLGNNVVGPHGIRVQNLTKGPAGKSDKTSRDKIQAGIKDFSRKGNFDVTGKLTFADGERLFLRSVARDGECLVRHIDNFNNPHGYAVQFLEPDLLPVDYNLARNDGTEIRMGVDTDKWGRPRMYWLLNSNPAESFQSRGGKRISIDAMDIIHEFITESPRQTRGFPWCAATATKLNNLDGFENAALVNARAGASKMGFLEHTETTNSGQPGEYLGEGTDEDGNTIQEFQAGLIEKLPRGYKFTEHNPRFPDAATQQFIRAMLLGAASGLLTQYHTLSGDLTGVSFSSIRQGNLDERDQWRVLQWFVVNGFTDQVIRRWLPNALFHGAVDLPISQLDRFNAWRYLPRNWDWINPKQEVDANAKAAATGQANLSDILAKTSSHSVEEHLEIMVEENEMFEQKGIDLNTLLGRNIGEDDESNTNNSGGN